MPGATRATLERMVGHLWPRRTDRERLFDLGEHKGWREPEYAAALGETAGWLTRALGLRPTGQPPPAETTWGALKLSLSSESQTHGLPTARWLTTLGPAVGATPKTLANSLAKGYQPRRPDHRWLGAIARVHAGGGQPQAWLYHRRTPSAVSAALGARAPLHTLDAGDALLVLSLISLWQRRRPTHHARGNRGQPTSRRHTPKPVAGLTLIQPGQVAPLLGLADRLARPTLGLLAFEAALTQAHLAPHPTRRRAVTDDGEALLAAVEAGLAAPWLDAPTRAMLRYRVDRMRAWLAHRRQAAPPPIIAGAPYVRATLAIHPAVPRGGAPAARISADEPGVMMLLPQLAARGVRVERWPGRADTSSTSSTSAPTASARPTDG